MQKVDQILAIADRVSILSWNFDNSHYFKHSYVNVAKKYFLMVLIFNLQNKKSKYDDNDDPDNKLITSCGNKSEILFFLW